VKDQAENPYRIKGNIVVLYTLVVTSFIAGSNIKDFKQNLRRDVCF
jgi:hypothetical protein